MLGHMCAKKIVGSQNRPFIHYLTLDVSKNGSNSGPLFQREPEPYCLLCLLVTTHYVVFAIHHYLWQL